MASLEAKTAVVGTGLPRFRQAGVRSFGGNDSMCRPYKDLYPELDLLEYGYSLAVAV